MTTFLLKDIQPNPFRHLDRYPINAAKVAILRESIRSTSFWDNLIARERNGHAEIAYGHHRLEALRQEYGGTHRVTLTIRDLSDEQMLKIMARENMEEWGASAAVEHETVRAVVQAYADGRIVLPTPPKTTDTHSIRYAPSFVPGRSGAESAPLPYTMQAVADFIGWIGKDGKPRSKVRHSFLALQFIEERLLAESDFAGLTVSQAGALVEETMKARNRRETLARVHEREAAQAAKVVKRAETPSERRQAERRVVSATKEAERLKVQGREQAKKVATVLKQQFTSGAIGVKQAPAAALKVDVAKTNGAPPLLERYAEQVTARLAKCFDPAEDEIAKRLDAILPHLADLDPHVRKDLIATAEKTAARLGRYIRAFQGERASLVGGSR